MNTPNNINLRAVEACQALVDAYAAGAEDGEHPQSVEWSDVDRAHELAVAVVREPAVERESHLLGTLETLLSALDEGHSPADLLNYINTQVRNVVQLATGRDTSAGHLTLSEELRAACRADELLAALRSLSALYGREQDCHIEERISRFEAARDLIAEITHPSAERSPRSPAPLPVPPDIWAEITAAERARLGIEDDVGTDHACAAYFPDYCTDSPGYHGPLVVVVWPAGPDAMSTFKLRDGKWWHCNSSAW